MSKTKYDDAVLRSSIETIKELTEKDNHTVLTEISLSIAKKCVDFTPPKNKKEGTSAVERDINKLHVNEELLAIWADSQGKNVVAKRISEVIKREDYDAAQAIFRNTPHLRNIEVKEFSPDLHEKQRDSRGRVNLKQPRYLFTNPATVKNYIKQEKKKVGYAKASFAGWVRALGGNVPQWIGRYINNDVKDESLKKLIPRITMISLVAYIGSLNDRNNIVQRAVDVGSKNMVSRIKYLMREAKKKAGFK